MIAFPRILGVVADTHGLVRPQLLRALEGCERILHAGDIGGAEVLDALEAVAPVVAVRGNNDRGAWAEPIPEEELVEVGPARLWMLHDVHDLRRDPVRDGLAAVIAGHSHRPRVAEEDGVLFLNPGSAGPRRFRLPVTCARLTVTADGVSADLLDLLGGDG